MSTPSNQNAHERPNPRILAQTERWIVVDKPPGWLSIPPSATHHRAPQLESVREWLERERGEKVWVVHRLDRETSGVLLFARNESAHRMANGWFEGRETRKRYACLAQGAPKAPVFLVKRPIEGKSSSTQFEVKERFGSAFLAHALPQTGRRHQIRIHLSEEGYPILGDQEYGGAREIGLTQITRVALHALRLELPGGEAFEAPLPEDFERWIAALRANAAAGGAK